MTRLKNKLSLYKKYFPVILIVFVAFYLRTYNVNWDDNYYFHPDERAIIMFAAPLKLPLSISQFLSTESPLNPHFFAYGNFPLYLVKLLGVSFSFIDPLFSTYGGLHIIGRVISASLDTVTALFVFMLGSLMFSKRAGFYGSILYTFSVFPIQTSHFYAVDIMLTFFITGSIFFLLNIIEKPTALKSILGGLFIGLAISTKISGIILVLYTLLALFFSFYLNKVKILKTFYFFLIIITVSLIVFSVTQPYALIDWNNFILQTKQQSQMGSDPFVFPYTLQYVGKIPYLYELKNIAFFGIGPINFIFLTGGLITTITLLKKHNRINYKILFILVFLFTYFAIFGKFAVGWMRYMLPIYPFFAVLGGLFVANLIKKMEHKFSKRSIFDITIPALIIIVILIYPISFMHIYTQKNTRLQASDWIYNNIPFGSVLAVEHWDDALPVHGGSNYQQISLPLYDPDTEQKWQLINGNLQNSDYIIIASNRLYKPLTNLINCDNLPPGRCYPITAQYYKELFAGNRGFTKVAEFSEYPTIPIINLEINDQDADESFTVYDHPKIMIFKKD